MQTPWQSAKEAVHQMWIGFLLSVVANYLYVLLFGPVSTVFHTITLTAWMTMYSFARTYIIRRWHARKEMPEV